MKKRAAALVSLWCLAALCGPSVWAADAPPAEREGPDLSDPEAFVMDLIRVSVRQNKITRKAMENYAFREDISEFEHMKDGTFKPSDAYTNWNYYSKKYEEFRSVPLLKNGRETTLREREKHAREEEKALEKRNIERARAKERLEREKEKQRLEKEREAAKKPPPSASAQASPASPSPSTWGAPPPSERKKEEAAAPAKAERMDEGKARGMAEQHATPTDGLEDISKAAVSLGWVKLSITDIVRHFEFTYEGDDEHEGEPVHIVRYRKRLDVEEPKRELRKAVPPVEGRLWITRRGRDVVRMDMTLMDDVRYKPKAGFDVREAEFSVYMKKVDGRHWFESDMAYAVNGSFWKVVRFHEHGKIRRHDFKVFTVETKEGGGAAE